MPERPDSVAARAVATSLARNLSGFMRASELTTTLLAMGTWQERLSLLRGYPTLVHQAVADRCHAEGAEQLARFVKRGATVGLKSAAAELDILDALEQATKSPAEVPAAALEQPASAIVGGATWLLPEFLEAAAAVSRHRPEQSAEIIRIAVPPVARATGATANGVHQLLVLAFMEWDDIWPRLESVVCNDTVADAFPAAVAVAALSADLPQLGTWVSDLRGLIDAARTRGAEAAHEEHKLRILAQLFAEGEGLAEFDDPAAVCAQLAVEIATHVQRSGATWIIPAAIDVARKAVELTDIDAAPRASRLSNLSAMIADGVNAGVCPADDLDEALRAAREAYRIGSADTSTRARISATLGNRISQAVDAGLVNQNELVTAVSLHQEAWELTGADDPARAQRASNLGALLSTAIESGLLPVPDLTRALKFQDEAVRAAEPSGPDLPWLLSNRANRTAQAVQLSVLPSEALLQGIDDLRRAIAMTNRGHPGYRGVVSNLSSLLSEAIHAGHLTPAHVPESITLAEEALQLTPKASLDWPRFANNLANRLGVGVTTGFESLDRLATAVELSREAVDATPIGHSARAGRVATLIGRTLAAIDAGVAHPELVRGVLDEAESMWLATSPTHPLRSKLANDMAVLLSEAVKHDIIEPGRLADAVEIGREGLALTQPDHPDWPASASNLGAILSEAIGHGVVTASKLAEAIDLTQTAFNCALNAPTRADLATNASTLIAEAIAAGVIPSGRIGEALSLQQAALELVAFPHPDRPAYAANMIQRVADALAQGLIAADDALERVNRLVAEAWEQATVSVTPIQRRHVLALSNRLIRYAPLLLLQLTDDPVESALAVESLRGHVLRGMRAPRLAPGVVSPGCEARYASAAAGYDLSQLHAMDGIGTYAHSLAAFRALADAIADVRAERPDAVPGLRPSRTELLRGVPEDVAVIYLVPGANTTLSSYSGSAIVVGHDADGSVPLPKVTQQAVAENVEKILNPAASIDDVCSWLWDALIQPLLEQAAAGSGPLSARTWAFIPTGLIGMLPLHAAGGPDRMLDDVTRVLTIRCALSAEAHVSSVPVAQHPPIAMALPADDLKFTTADMAIARVLIPDGQVLPSDTRPADLLAALSEASALLLSGHALHALDVGGSIQLGPRETNLWLTGDDVARLPLRRRGLAILAACSSGQPALSLPEEAIGLPSALLAIGFTSVVSALWPVRDSVAFITIARFLQLRSADPTAGDHTTLQETRRWLRRATCTDLLDWLSQLEEVVELGPAATDALRREWESYPDLAEPVPYGDPRDWAAFSCTRGGCPTTLERS